MARSRDAGEHGSEEPPATASGTDFIATLNLYSIKPDQSFLQIDPSTSRAAWIGQEPFRNAFFFVQLSQLRSAQSVIRYGFETLGFETIVASTDVANTASIKVLEKLGMSFDRREILDGLDTVFYRLQRRHGS